MGMQVAARAVAAGEAGRRGMDGAAVSACVALSLAEVAGCIRTGCVYEEQPEGTFGLLVTRHDPRTRWRRSRVVQAPIHAHWAELAPSVRLLTGRTAGCRARHCSGTKRHTGHVSEGGALSRLGWDGFAAAYHAELEARPNWLRLAVVRQIASWLCSYHTVTILSFEPSLPRGEALEAWQRRGEFISWAQRHVFREWLLRLPPIELCVVGAPAPERGAVVKDRDGGMVR